MKTWFSQMIGVAVPEPGIATFHLMFVSLAQLIGGFAEGATPFWLGHAIAANCRWRSMRPSRQLQRRMKLRA